MVEEKALEITKRFCCSNTPLEEARFISIFDIVSAMFYLMLLLFTVYGALTGGGGLIGVLIDRYPEKLQDLDTFLKSDSPMMPVILILSFFRTIIDGLLGGFLYVATLKGNYKYVQLWILPSAILFSLDLIFLLPKVVILSAAPRLHGTLLLLTSLGYKAYSIWIAYFLVGDLRSVHFVDSECQVNLNAFNENNIQQQQPFDIISI